MICGYHGIKCDYKGDCIDCPHTLEQKWIPISERLPDLDGTYLVTIAYTDRRVIKIVKFANDLKKIDRYTFKYETDPGWYVYDNEYGHYTINNIVAWQPLPSPYKGE